MGRFLTLLNQEAFLNSWWSLKSLCGTEKLQYVRKFQTRQMLMLWDGCQTDQQFQSISIIGALGMRLRSQLSYKSDLWSVSKCSGRCINTHVKYKYPKFGLNFSIWVTVVALQEITRTSNWILNLTWREINRLRHITWDLFLEDPVENLRLFFNVLPDMKISDLKDDRIWHHKDPQLCHNVPWQLVFSLPVSSLLLPHLILSVCVFWWAASTAPWAVHQPGAGPVTRLQRVTDSCVFFVFF